MDQALLPQTAAEYITLVRQLGAITDLAMDVIQADPPARLVSLDRIAHNVETVACLRGDSGVYNGSRPAGLIEYQTEMYAIEDRLRKRLLSLGYMYPPSRLLSETV